MSSLSESVAELRDNPEQWEAFLTEGHCVVLAPPGSGKTKLLATRAAYDLANRVPRPHGAACITLTNPAADELRRRIAALGADRRSTFFVGTVHSFALTRIILSFAHPAGMAEVTELKIASQATRAKALRDSVDEVFPRAMKNDLRLAQSTIERNRKLMATEDEWRLTGPALREAARRYEARLRSQGLMDFDDVVSYAVTLVEQHEFVRRTLTARYPHLYVDEYQDLAPGLDRLVKALCFDYRNASELFAVGDPDQAVFGWTGTRPELLNELAESPFVTPIRLEINYRCGTDIIVRAHRLLDGPRSVSGRRSGGIVEAHYEPSGFSAQTEAAAHLVFRLRAAGTPLHEIVVLCSTREECAEAADALRAAGAPAYCRGSEYDQTPVTLLIEALVAWAVLGHESSGHRLGDLLRRWRDVLGDYWTMSASTALVSLLTAYEGREREPASQFLGDVLAIGLHAAITTAGRSDEAAAVADMTRELTTGRLAAASAADLAARARNLNRVQVTTTSSGKGLEFDIVLLLGADEGKMPHFSSVGDTEKLDEDRRKFYVSVTRARQQVHIFYSGFDDRYGRIRPNGPSRFLRLLGLVPADTRPRW
jgi:DNA helicase II / ATP-dependent DNA helicase PcrA